MPKFPFGRRKSSGNALEEFKAGSATSSTFKVFEQPGSTSLDGAQRFTKESRPPLGPNAARPEENMFEGLINTNRGSGASNTNTASTAEDDSSRMSATSTAPSSTISKGDEFRSPHDMPFKNIPVPPVPKSTPSFSLRASARTFSFGRHKNTSTPPPVPARTPPTERGYETGRGRAMTTSSYASTATPPKLADQEFSLTLGGSFTDMFSSIGKRKSQVLLDAETRKPDLRGSDSTAPSSFSTNHANHPPPLNIDNTTDVEPSPYSWSSQHSQHGLMQSSTSPLPVSRRPVSQSRSSESATDTLPSNNPQRPGGLADMRLRRTSAHNGRRQSLIESRKSIDEDARLLRDAAYASQRLNQPEAGAKVRDSWALPLNQFDGQPDEAAVAGFMSASTDSTPRPKGVELHDAGDSMFDINIAESANLAERFEQMSTPSPPSKFAPKNKVMTPAQFERYKKDQDRVSSYGPLARKKQEEEEEEEEVNYEEEDDDDVEKAKQLAKQRRRQEAHMSVYRQQMMKVTGETSAGMGGHLRPASVGAHSSANLVALGRLEDKEDEDEEIPLAILQAHGFPNKLKAPVRPTSSIPNLRAQSMMSGALPVFARNLPQDPYLGAGLAYPTNRESMGFGGGAGSVHGGSVRNSHPNLPAGGLVGVIANEERSRAMRRGSPSQINEYSTPPPANGFDGMGGMGGMGVGMGPNPRASTLLGGMPPGAMPQNPSMLSPGDHAQLQMSQQMQQFMQMQMQFMQLMTSGQTPPAQGQTSPQQVPDFAQGGLRTPPQGRPASAHMRSQTMMESNSAAWLPQGGLFAPSVHNQGGYVPSIAPSERSNVGMPGRYRPVSHIPGVDNSKSRASSIEGALQGWDNKNRTSTIKVVTKPNTASDDEDEEGWEEMAKKREKKRSLWRTKKENNDMREMLSYT